MRAWGRKRSLRSIEDNVIMVFITKVRISTVLWGIASQRREFGDSSKSAMTIAKAVAMNTAADTAATAMWMTCVPSKHAALERIMHYYCMIISKALPISARDTGNDILQAAK